MRGKKVKLRDCALASDLVRAAWVLGTLDLVASENANRRTKTYRLEVVVRARNCPCRGDRDTDIRALQISSTTRQGLYHPSTHQELRAAAKSRRKYKLQVILHCLTFWPVFSENIGRNVRLCSIMTCCLTLRPNFTLEI